MHGVKGMSPQQIRVHILTSLANKYPCNLEKFFEKVSFLITCLLRLSIRFNLNQLFLFFVFFNERMVGLVRLV